nr:retrovirus-related Pol polyprotein from transposon TNT 1-94 [Tanacetum cinerariifolium]
ARTKKPTIVPISTRKPKSQARKSIATPHKKQVASKSTKQKPQSYFRVLYENTNNAWKWWIERQSPSGYKWVPKPKKQWVPKAKMQWIIQLIIFIVDSGCTKHMTGNLKLLCNFVEKFPGTIRFGNDHFAPILGYGDLVQGNVTINRVYYVEGLNHNLFSVGQFYDADFEARTKKPTIVPISTRKPKSQARKSIATPHKKQVASKSTKQKPQSYFRVLYENTNNAWKWWIERQSPSGYKWVPKPKKQWVPKAKMQWVPKAKNDQVHSELKKLIEKGKGKYVDTKFDRPSVV